jgi:hypothetical protein
MAKRTAIIRTGKYLRRIDDGLPSQRTQRLHGPLPRNRTYLLAQLRTGHSWLATCAKAKGLNNEDKCECGARETEVHVLVDCPKFRDLRQQLRNKIRDAFNSISSMLGGRSPGNHDQTKGWSINRDVLNAVLDYTETSQRFRTREVERSQNRDSGQRNYRRPQ